MYHLAKVTKESGVSVVIGGEGADEIFLGNNLFKEHESRRGRFAETAALNDPLFSHLPSFTSSRIDDFYTPDFKASLGGLDVITELRASLPTRFFGWSPLNQAAYLEMITRLSPYLLSSNGDRMTMAHAVEGRYPFLDHRLFEFAAALPTGSRLRGLREKEVLRWTAEGKTAYEIGQILQVSERTVNFHINNVVNKLGASNKTQAAVKAATLGMLA